MIVAALIIALPVAALLLATAAIYAAARRRGEAGTAPLPAAAAALAFLRESLAMLALITARLLPARAEPIDRTPHRVALLIPEMHCSASSFWYLLRHLHAHGWAGAAGPPRTIGAAQTFAALDARIAALPPACELVLIGHGIGGLLAHRYVQARPAARIRHVVTLGTPHQGSAALPYRLLSDRGAIPPALPATGAASTDVIAIYSDFDAWLVPVDDAYCPGGFNIAVRGVGHCAMLLSRRVADLIVENLAAPVGVMSAAPTVPIPRDGCT